MMKIVDSIHYHVWSDALHARQLARQTESPWDRGAYVRWAILTAWSAFENYCADALAAKGLGNRFKDRFNEAASARALPPVNWGQGIWQQILQIYEERIKFAHVVPSISQEKLMTPLEDAEDAIRILRDGIRAVADLAGLLHPPWVSDNADRGWQRTKSESSLTAHGTVINAEAREADPENVRICYLWQGRERCCEIAPPGTDPRPLMEKLISSLNVPVEAIRAYRGSVLIEEPVLKLR